MKQKKGLLVFSSIILAVFSFAQTGSEKVAAAYCECSKTMDLQASIDFMQTSDSAEISAKSDELVQQFIDLKNCAKQKYSLNRKEEKSISESDIDLVMEKYCPQVLLFRELFVKAIPYVN